MLRFIVLCMLVASALAGNWNLFQGKAKATPIVQQAVKSMPILQEQAVQSKALPILQEQAVVQGKTLPILQEQAVQSKAFKSMPILQEQAVVQGKGFTSGIAQHGYRSSKTMPLKQRQQQTMPIRQRQALPFRQEQAFRGGIQQHGVMQATQTKSFPM